MVNAQMDWPQLRGPNRDGISQETGFLKSWPKKGSKVLWKARIGEGFSAVSVSDGRAFTMFVKGEDEFVICFDALTGEEKWRFRSDDKFYERQGENEPRSTPAVFMDRVFALSPFGKLYALEARTGEVIWHYDLQ